MASRISKKWWVLGGTVTAAGGLYYYRKITREQEIRRHREKWAAAGKDVVVLHQPLKNKDFPKVTPPYTNVETYMRLAGIKYVRDEEDDVYQPFWSLRKFVPWITLNGEETDHTYRILDRLEKHFDVPLDKHLDKERTAVLEAVRMMLDNKAFKFWRCGSKPPYKWGGPVDKKPFSKDDYYAFCKKACGVLDTLLGNRKFFGGEKPSSADCAIFAFTSQLMFGGCDSEYETLIKDVYPRLGQYTLSMRNVAYPDWGKEPKE